MRFLHRPFDTSPGRRPEGGPHDLGDDEQRHRGRPGDLVGDLSTRLVVYLAAHAPPGRLARSRGAEAVLARACVVLTDWETAYRTGQLPDRTIPLYADPGLTVDALLAAVPDHQVAELVDLTTRAHHAGLLARLAPAPPAHAGISGPVFVPHWADGDLLFPTTDPPPPGPAVDEDGATGPGGAPGPPAAGPTHSPGGHRVAQQRAEHRR
ncbi:hypothetical protein [uncultured Pseudonocardia sp.]|uniref:hypothetical protein n=1 Tax=uncultured Pseudonocardia sp. TaxID=211455 RepID=UPI0026334DF6|nr:hypothetical protein [uncultured Pseudonocardia sp.]